MDHGNATETNKMTHVDGSASMASQPEPEQKPSAKNKAKADCSLCEEVGADLTPENGTWDCKNLGVKRFCQLNCPDRKRAVFAECIVSRNEGFAINSQLSLEDNTCEAVIGPCDVSLVKKNAPDNFKWNGIDYSSTFDFSTSHSNTKIALWGRRRCNSGSGFHHNTQILCKINRNGAKWIYKGNANKKCRND
ncbi:unnamed protein product [Oikopleura dioica]|uniref:Uncharacterized protein n=1 Tax=Oikopleura dioica TaxID=34765 RepID=E4YGM9_OIKDI|nr:unnamed protein product [Oikopleura dioica]